VIAIDQAMTAIRESKRADLVELIAQDREDRMAMVQSTEQYKV
jgi:hypothetical protein